MNKKIVQINVRIPLDQLNKLEYKAITENTTLSKVIRQTFADMK